MISVFVLLAVVCVGAQDACDVLCRGPVLEAVSTVEPPLFHDSKAFVDMVLQDEPEVILAAFNASDAAHNRSRLVEFIAQYFSPAGSDVHSWTPDDWAADIPFFNKLTDPQMRAWARQVHGVWPSLGKSLNDSIYTHTHRHTLLPLRHPHMIVPGGRFIEFYYWDSYWIVKGLLTSGMFESAQMIVENLLDLVKRFGFVPNGSRQYYLSRSQPPYLTLMIELLVDAEVVNATFVEEALPILNQEYNWWMVQGEHAVDVTGEVRKAAPHLNNDDTYTLNRYFTHLQAPRAESSREAFQTASHVPEEQRAALYAQIIAGAESGWDYTSRWFSDGATLSTIGTSNLLPVDLNALMFKVEHVLAKLHSMVNLASPLDYVGAAERRAIAIRALLWNGGTDQWFDYNMTSGTQTTHVSPANFLPVWFGLLDPALYANITVDDIAFSMKASGLVGPGGTCGSLIETGQQWDFPNVWPPLQHMLVEGLMTAEQNSEARKLGEQMATTFLQTAFIAYNNTGGYLLEKYNCTKLGAVGGGGEYELQAGFGWTNGVILSLLDHFPNTAAPSHTAPEWGSYFN